MSVLVFVENIEGNYKKTAFEAVSYGHKTAQVFGSDLVVLTVGNGSHDELAKYGASKIIQIDNEVSLSDSKSLTKVIANVASDLSAKAIVLSNSTTGKGIAGRLSVRLNAGLVSGVIDVPSQDGAAKKGVFSGKAFEIVKPTTEVKIYAITPNAFGAFENGASAAIENKTVEAGNSSITVKSREVASGTVPLSEAELVVSGGRGLKGPENWGIIEDLATTIGATTACSRPVADSHWRPHHEHVGQTGGTIRPNLYIAVGISGAIQHLAGVNQSKCIVVINKDPEAPFFKAADYGIIGDAFEVMPKIIEAAKAFKG